MATVKAVLNKDRIKKRGGYSLVIQIIHKRVKRVVYTPYSLEEAEFDSVKQKAAYVAGLNLPYKKIKEINLYIKDKKKEVENIIATISSRNPNYVVQDIVCKYQQDQDNKYLITFLDRLIAKKEMQGRIGMAKAFRSTLRSLEKFINKQAIRFVDIDHNFVKDYECYLEGTGIKQNTMNFYIRNLRTVYNMAYDSGIEMINVNAFRKIHIKQCKTTKRALGKETIRQIAEVNLSHSRLMERARDIFMFSYYARGMSFVDIIYLKNSDIENNVISYKRHKTHKDMQVTITPPLQAIINKYHSDSVYVLPFITESLKPTLYEKYQAAYGNIYRGLNGIQIFLGIPTPLTMHVARHSWATIAKNEGGTITEICEGMGHGEERTTGIYLKEFDHSVIDSLNEKVVYFQRN